MRAWRLRLPSAHPDPETGNVNPDSYPSLSVRSRVIGVRLRVGPWTDSALRHLGLYVAPPEKAIVLCVDEKPSIQALERAQGYLKLKNEHWLKAHPNVQFHFTPTSASWLNQVEVWFSILQGQSLSGASFTRLQQLQQHIDAYIKAYNQQAEPFVWTKKKARQRRFKGRRITQL